MPSATVYARMHRNFLEKHHPKTYRQLKASGQLVEHLKSVGQTAVDLYETIEIQMMTSPNLPTDQRAREAKLKSIPFVAEEIVLHDVVFNPTP